MQKYLEIVGDVEGSLDSTVTNISYCTKGIDIKLCSLLYKVQYIQIFFPPNWKSFQENQGPGLLNVVLFVGETSAPTINYYGINK